MSASSNVADTVLSGLPRVRDWQEGFYRDLHEHPELSHQEFETARKVADRLRGCGFEVHNGIGGTGVIGVLDNGSGPGVLLHADMDALPVEEATGLDYASTARATDADGNEVPVMHACGHDVHVTALLGAAQLLAGGADHWDGTVVALIQPAEETADGARAMLDDGLAELLPAVDVALAQHVLPAPSGKVGTRAGPLLSAADSMPITVYGRGAHGSMPQAAVDLVVLAAMIVVRLQTIVAREVAPGESAVLTVGSIRAGSKSNVIPDQAVLQLNPRTYSEQTRTATLSAIRRIVHNHPPGSAQKDVEVFNAVINMVVADGLLLWRQLDLVDLKRRDAKTFADPFVEGTRRGVRAWPCGQRCWVDDPVGHLSDSRCGSRPMAMGLARRRAEVGSRESW